MSDTGATDGDTVFFTSRSAHRGTRTFHTSRDCSRLINARNVLSRPRHRVEDRMRHCSVCRDGEPGNPDQDRSIYEAAVATDPEALEGLK